MKLIYLLKKYGCNSIYYQNKCSKYINDNDLMEELVCKSIDERLEKLTEKPDDYGKVIVQFIIQIISNHRQEYKRRKVVPIARRLEEEGFTGEHVEKEIIIAFELHALTEFPITDTEMCELNEAIIKFCKEKENKTFSFFAYCLRGSKNLNSKVNIPYDQLEEETRKNHAEFLKMFGYDKQPDD